MVCLRKHSSLLSYFFFNFSAILEPIQFLFNLVPCCWSCMTKTSIWLKIKNEGKHVTIICGTGETTPTAHNLFALILLPSLLKLSSVLQRCHWFRHELHGWLWSSRLPIPGCRRIPEWVNDYPIWDDCFMNSKKSLLSKFFFLFFFKQMRTSPTPKLSSWPSPLTTMLEMTRSIKSHCSGRKNFLKLSRNTREILLPTSPLHTWQRYIWIFKKSMSYFF